MCEYFTIDAYKDAERVGQAYSVKGKLYTRVKRKCPKCGGTGEYKHFGTCYNCKGAGYIIEETRLFTAEEKAEFEAKKDADAAAFEKIQGDEEKEAKMRWLAKHGFTKDGYTYVVLGDTYSIKEKLKALGYQYSNYIKWHAPLYEESSDIITKKIYIDEYYEWAPGIKGYIITSEGKEKFDRLYAEEQQLNTEWFGTIGEKFSRLKVTFRGRREKESAWGPTELISFVDENNHLLVWNTKTYPTIPTGQFYLSATVKAHTGGGGKTKTTYIQRAKLEVIDEI